MILHAARNSRGRRPERIYESPILRRPTLPPRPCLLFPRHRRISPRFRLLCTTYTCIARNKEPRLRRLKPIRSIKLTYDHRIRGSSSVCKTSSVEFQKFRECYILIYSNNLFFFFSFFTWFRFITRWYRLIYPSVQLRSVAYSTRFRNVIESWRRGAITTWRTINYRLSHLSLSACAAWRWTPSPRNGKENRRGEKNSGRRREVGSGSKETRRTEGKKSFLVSSRFNYFAGLLIHGCDIQRVYIYIVCPWQPISDSYILRSRWAWW